MPRERGQLRLVRKDAGTKQRLDVRNDEVVLASTMPTYKVGRAYMCKGRRMRGGGIVCTEEE